MIRLRRLQEKDAAGMLEWMNDQESKECFRFDVGNKTVQDVLAFINNSSIELKDGDSIHYAICDASDEYLGTISLKRIDLVSQNAEYAISMRKNARGTGIAYAATMELLKIAFENYGLNKVYLNVLAINKRAIRFYQKCGFVYEGEFRNHLFLHEKFQSLLWYGILADEYHSLKTENKKINDYGE